MIYRTNFNLLEPVEDKSFYDAKDYLLEDTDLLTGLINERLGCKSDPIITKIEWKLTNLDKGFVQIETNKPLNDVQKMKVSEFISGQCSDGLGEGFEQAFAYHLVDDFADPYNEDEDEGYYVMPSFDWEKNEYELEEYND